MGETQKEWLTTGQAARLCSVTSDTVLKWIRRGRLAGRRTAGGHYRIARRDIEDLMTPHYPVEGANGQASAVAPLRCWEFLSGRDSVPEECLNCAVYRVRAGWCFEMSGLCTAGAERQTLCAISCDECSYYRRAMGLATKILLVTGDEKLAGGLRTETDEAIDLRIVRSEYEAAAILQEFQPAFSIIDEAGGLGNVADLLEHLARDPRVTGMKVILAVASGRGERRRNRPLHENVVRIIEKPFRLSHVVEIVADFPVESLAGRNGGQPPPG